LATALYKYTDIRYLPRTAIVRRRTCMCTGGPCRYWLPQIHERGARRRSRRTTGKVFAVVWEVILITYEISAPDSTPCPDHVERLRSACPWSMAVGE
jgi:hypothetical protein